MSFSVAMRFYTAAVDISSTAAALMLVAARKAFRSSASDELEVVTVPLGSRKPWQAYASASASHERDAGTAHSACSSSMDPSSCAEECGSQPSDTSASSAASSANSQSAASASEAEAPCTAASPCACAFGLPGVRAERVLGEGACGVAWLATQTLPDGSERQVVVKRSKKGSASGPGADMLHEAEVMRAMEGNPHAVQLYDVTTDEDGSTCLVMQYGSRASLIQELDVCKAEREAAIADAAAAVEAAVAAKAPRKELAALRRAVEAARGRMVLSRRRLAQLARSMLLALKQLNRTGYMHLDIKPDNIFLDESGNYMLGDYGISVRQVNGTWPWLGSTPLYASAEMTAALSGRLPKSAVTLATDLPSLGLTLATAAAFHGDMSRLAAYGVWEADLPSWTDPDLKDLVEGLQADLPKRLSVDAALAHPFLKHAE